MNELLPFALKASYINRYPSDTARFLETYTATELESLADEIPLPTLKKALDKMPADILKDQLESMSPNQKIQILKALSSEQAANVLVQYSKNARKSLLEKLTQDQQRDIKDILEYPPETAGYLMDPNIITFRKDTTVEEAIERIKSKKKRGIRILFLVDDQQHPNGMVSIQSLAMAEPKTPLADLVKPIPALIEAMTPQEEIVDTLEGLKMTDLPVVDAQGVLIGVIRHHILFHATQEEMTKDIQTMVGVSEQEKARSKVLFAVSKRLPWLLINLLTCFMAAFVVGFFEGTIAQYTALAVLLPVVAGQSGNTGAQALAVTMRGLALKEVRFSHWMFLVGKEMRIALFTGISVAVVTSIAVGIWSQSIGLMFIIGISMVVSMLIAGMSGAAVPLVLARLGLDPASSSSIILTTVTDICGFFSFLGIATLLMGLI